MTIWHSSTCALPPPNDVPLDVPPPPVPTHRSRSGIKPARTSTMAELVAGVAAANQLLASEAAAATDPAPPFVPFDSPAVQQFALPGSEPWEAFQLAVPTLLQPAIMQAGLPVLGAAPAQQGGIAWLDRTAVGGVFDASMQALPMAGLLGGMTGHSFMAEDVALVYGGLAPGFGLQHSTAAAAPFPQPLVQLQQAPTGLYPSSCPAAVLGPTADAAQQSPFAAFAAAPAAQAAQQQLPETQSPEGQRQIQQQPQSQAQAQPPPQQQPPPPSSLQMPAGTGVGTAVPGAWQEAGSLTGWGSTGSSLAMSRAPSVQLGPGTTLITGLVAPGGQLLSGAPGVPSFGRASSMQPAPVSQQEQGRQGCAVMKEPVAAGTGRAQVQAALEGVAAAAATQQIHPPQVPPPPPQAQQGHGAASVPMPHAATAAAGVRPSSSHPHAVQSVPPATNTPQAARVLPQHAVLRSELYQACGLELDAGGAGGAGFSTSWLPPHITSWINITCPHHSALTSWHIACGCFAEQEAELGQMDEGQDEGQEAGMPPIALHLPGQQVCWRTLFCSQGRCGSCKCRDDDGEERECNASAAPCTPCLPCFSPSFLWG